MNGTMNAHNVFSDENGRIHYRELSCHCLYPDTIWSNVYIYNPRLHKTLIQLNIDIFQVSLLQENQHSVIAPVLSTYNDDRIPFQSLTPTIVDDYFSLDSCMLPEFSLAVEQDSYAVIKLKPDGKETHEVKSFLKFPDIIILRITVSLFFCNNKYGMATERNMTRQITKIIIILSTYFTYTSI